MQQHPPPERDKILRWVKASERLPKYPGDPQNHYRLDGEHKVHGNFHYSIDDERREGEIVFTVIGMGLFADYVITREKFNAIEFLEEVEAPLYSNQDTLRYKNALSHIRSYSLESPCSSRIINNIANAALTNSPAPAASPVNPSINDEHWREFTEHLAYYYEIVGGEKGHDLIWQHVDGGIKYTTAELLEIFKDQSRKLNRSSIEPGEQKSEIPETQKQLTSARQLILDIKRGNIYQEPADECDKWLNNNPEIKENKAIWTYNI